MWSVDLISVVSASRVNASAALRGRPPMCFPFPSVIIAALVTFSCRPEFEPFGQKKKSSLVHKSIQLTTVYLSLSHKPFVCFTHVAHTPWEAGRPIWGSVSLVFGRRRPSSGLFSRPSSINGRFKDPEWSSGMRSFPTANLFKE